MDLPGLTLQETEKQELVLGYRPVGAPLVIDLATLQAWIAAHGYGELAFDEVALQQAVQHIRQGASLGKPIGRRIDTIYQVEVAPDKFTARLTVLPPRGGKPVTLIDAQAALAKAGVIHGVQEAALAAAVGRHLGQPVEVATGERPLAGVDAWLEPLVNVNQLRHPRIDDKGHVDFRDLGVIPTVSAGEAVMRRHPPQPGKPGRNVLGAELGAPPGKDMKFAVRLQGVVAEAADPDLLRAAVAGQPVLLRDGVNIEPLITLEKVDISSGNVEFVGSVTIRGDVQSGMRIKAGGDVTVEGTIEAAEVIAGGNVIAKGGIVGHSAQGKDDAQKADTARITAHGSVKARYIENAHILAEQAVVVDESIVQSDVTAVDRVEVGQPGKKKGYIMGGFIRATLGVTAEFLGGPGSGQTRVFVGINPLLQRALDEQKQRLESKLKEHGDLSKVVQILKQRPDRKEMLEKAQSTLKKVSEEIAETMEEERRLNTELKLADTAEIKVLEGAYAGTTVALGKKSKFIGEDFGRGIFRLSDGELVYGDLPR